MPRPRCSTHTLEAVVDALLGINTWSFDSCVLHRHPLPLLVLVNFRIPEKVALVFFFLVFVPGKCDISIFISSSIHNLVSEKRSFNQASHRFRYHAFRSQLGSCTNGPRTLLPVWSRGCPTTICKNRCSPSRLCSITSSEKRFVNTLPGRGGIVTLALSRSSISRKYSKSE